jgi:pimeloyl-ACP methyl ester carboxylesterase
LAARGVPSLRIDKRGMFSSAAPGVDPNAVTIELYAEDARAWAREAARKAGAPCAWLLGHSEGALVALAAAQDSRAPICGVLAVSGPGRRLGQILREQLRANPANGPILPQAEAAIAEVEAGRTVDVAALHPGLQPLFAAPVQPFLRSLFAQDPAVLARQLKTPLLIVQGETDLQTSPADAEALKAARPGATRVTLPGVNHVLKHAPLDRALNLATYADPSLPIAREVLDAVVTFVRTEGPPRPSGRSRDDELLTPSPAHVGLRSDTLSLGPCPISARRRGRCIRRRNLDPAAQPGWAGAAGRPPASAKGPIC